MCLFPGRKPCPARQQKDQETTHDAERTRIQNRPAQPLSPAGRGAQVVAGVGAVGVHSCLLEEFRLSLF